MAAQKRPRGYVQVVLLLKNSEPDKWLKRYAGLTVSQAVSKFDEEERIEWIGEPSYVNGTETSLRSNQVLGDGDILSFTRVGGI